MTPRVDPSSAAPQFFPTPAHLHTWFEKHGADAEELWVGFFKKSTGRASVTWSEAVDEALCVGWIDGVRKGIDDESYLIRFAPRKRRSTWSVVNIKRVEELAAQGRMQPPGLAAFASRTEDNSGVYSFEQAVVELDEQSLATFRASPDAWSWFQQQPAFYRKAGIWWVVSAKRETTRQSRLTRLVEESLNHRRLAHLTAPRRRPAE